MAFDGFLMGDSNCVSIGGLFSIGGELGGGCLGGFLAVAGSSEMACVVEYRCSSGLLSDFLNFIGGLSCSPAGREF